MAANCALTALSQLLPEYDRRLSGPLSRATDALGLLT
jgi:hypothetical protein